jgi:hypothetical protein
VQTLTPSLQAHPVTGIFLEKTPTGIRRWSIENRDADTTAAFLASGQGLTAKRCPSFLRGRRIPYLLVWKRERDGEVMEAVRLACQKPFDGSVELNRGATHEYVELKRTNGSITILRIVWRKLPRNGGRALLLRCPYCATPRRHVYGWEWDCYWGWSNAVQSISWRCRSCARLRYSSEGGYLRPNLRGLGHKSGEPWRNQVFLRLLPGGSGFQTDRGPLNLISPSELYL